MFRKFTPGRVAKQRKVKFMPGLSYATVLRCIAQDLELRALKTFDLTVEGDKCIVRGGYQPPPAETPVTLHYTAADVEELDGAGAEKRGSSAASSMEFLTLPQIFRAIGGVLDKNEDQLIRISNNYVAGQESAFRIEYETRDGERVVEDRPVSAVYGMCVSMYKKRGKASVASRK